MSVRNKTDLHESEGTKLCGGLGPVMLLSRWPSSAPVRGVKCEEFQLGFKCFGVLHHSASLC